MTQTMTTVAKQPQATAKQYAVSVPGICDNSCRNYYLFDKEIYWSTSKYD